MDTVCGEQGVDIKTVKGECMKTVRDCDEAVGECIVKGKGVWKNRVSEGERLGGWKVRGSRECACEECSMKEKRTWKERMSAEEGFGGWSMGGARAWYNVSRVEKRCERIECNGVCEYRLCLRRKRV